MNQFYLHSHLNSKNNPIIVEINTAINPIDNETLVPNKTLLKHLFHIYQYKKKFLEETYKLIISKLFSSNRSKSSFLKFDYYHLNIYQQLIDYPFDTESIAYSSYFFSEPKNKSENLS